MPPKLDDFNFDFLVTGMSLAEADVLMKLILAYVDAVGAHMAGGFSDPKYAVAEAEREDAPAASLR